MSVENNSEDMKEQKTIVTNGLITDNEVDTDR